MNQGEAKKVDLKVDISSKNMSPGFRYFVSICSGLFSVLMFYLTFSSVTSNYFNEDFWSNLLIAFILAAISFVFVSPWKKINHLLSSIICLIIALWLIMEETLFGGILFIIFAVSQFLHIFGISLRIIITKIISYINKIIIALYPFIKGILKFVFWIFLLCIGIWLIIALGPLWIIALILLAILFVITNR